MQPVPEIALRILSEQHLASGGFLSIRRQRIVARYPDGTESEAFPYDSVERRAIDAVVILAHFQEGGERFLYLRSALRPPLATRVTRSSPVPEPGHGNLWELPAGLVEPNESSAEGILRCAARETQEELGFELSSDQFVQLGNSVVPAPAMIPERQFFVEVEVQPQQRGEPTLDGSPLEYGGQIIAISLAEAVDRLRVGDFPDAKTELGIRRLADRYIDRSL